MIARYKTLVSMHYDLMQSAQEGQEKIERAKARLARYMEEKDDEILQHNNELARLQMRFDRARSDVIIWVSGQDRQGASRCSIQVREGVSFFLSLSLTPTSSLSPNFYPLSPLPLPPLPLPLRCVQAPLLTPL